MAGPTFCLELLPWEGRGSRGRAGRFAQTAGTGCPGPGAASRPSASRPLRGLPALGLGIAARGRFPEDTLHVPTLAEFPPCRGGPVGLLAVGHPGRGPAPGPAPESQAPGGELDGSCSKPLLGKLKRSGRGVVAHSPPSPPQHKPRRWVSAQSGFDSGQRASPNPVLRPGRVVWGREVGEESSGSCSSPSLPVSLQ